MAEIDERIYSDGQSAFEHGKAQAVCPHLGNGKAKRMWLAGWDEARRYASRPMVYDASGPARAILLNPVV